MYLIDSHVLVWHQNDDDRLSQNISDILESSAPQDLTVSDVSWWELTIKEAKGYLIIPGNVEGLHEDWAECGAAGHLGIEWKHIKQLRALPDIHRDPFDRMLVAQALVEGLILITDDPHIPKYPGVKTIW